jgi:hypothetical protein
LLFYKINIRPESRIHFSYTATLQRILSREDSLSTAEAISSNLRTFLKIRSEAQIRLAFVNFTPAGGI